MKPGSFLLKAFVSLVREKTEAGAPTPLFLAHKNLKPFIERHLGDVHYKPIKVIYKGGSVGLGIRADMIPKICEVWIDAERAGVLGPNQKVVAKQHDILLRGFAHVGIIALVDEATG